jgi:hypothetical protein
VILMGSEESQRYPPNFSSVKGIRFGGKWNPVIECTSSFPFLSALFDTILLTLPVPTNVFNSNISNYVSKIVMFDTIRDEELNFFIRFELEFIVRLAKMYPDNCLEKFSLAYKALSEVPKCSSTLFNKLFKLALSSSCTESELEDCMRIYSGYLVEEEAPSETKFEDEETSTSSPSKKKVRFDASTKPSDGQCERGIEFRNWTERSLETHWILEPLKRMHTIVTTIPNYISAHLDEIETHCKIILRFIVNCLENYGDFIIRTSDDFITVYCSICQVFLLGMNCTQSSIIVCIRS